MGEFSSTLERLLQHVQLLVELGQLLALEAHAVPARGQADTDCPAGARAGFSAGRRRLEVGGWGSTAGEQKATEEGHEQDSHARSIWSPDVRK